MYTLIEKAQLELRLEPSDQDWGLVNAAGERLGEFVEYFLGVSAPAVETRDWNTFMYDFVELMVESAVLVLEQRPAAVPEIRRQLERVWPLVMSHDGADLAVVQLQERDDAETAVFDLIKSIEKGIAST